jgi:hypothetical protein
LAVDIPRAAAPDAGFLRCSDVLQAVGLRRMIRSTSGFSFHSAADGFRNKKIGGAAVFSIDSDRDSYQGHQKSAPGMS